MGSACRERIDSEGDGEGENGEPTEGRKFEGGNSRKRKTVTAERWEKGRWIGAMGGRKGTRGKEERPSLGQGRHGEERRANARVLIAKRTRTVKLGAVESSLLPHGRRITDEEIHGSSGIFIFRAFQ